MPETPVLILTPVKDAAECVEGYWQRLFGLSYPHRLISVGLLEGDSGDSSFAELQRWQPRAEAEFARVTLIKRDYGYHLPLGVHRGTPAVQPARRSILARSRNQLLFRALRDEAWVLWLDVDVIEFPPNLIELLLGTGCEIVQPHCVLRYGGPTFDCNGWRELGRLHLDDLRGEGALVPLDTVGGTVLLVRADLHRDGLIFPPFPYGKGSPLARTGGLEIETEGLGIMAHDMGYRCWGLPHLEVLHRDG